MKRVFLAAMLLVAFAAQAAKLNIDRVEPENWYAGLKYNSLEIMVYGEGIGAATVTTDYPGVTIDSIAQLQSPNYLIICMSLHGVQPGTMNLNFQLEKKKKTVPFVFKPRSNSGKQGFSNADVLYMLMPDRFANGNPANDKVRGMRSQVCDRNHPSYRHGGDLEGIRQHLDYFNDLGVTALWFTPVLENDSPESPWNDTYHGYATTNYYRVDPRFGTNDEYKRLIDEAHAKGLKVVMDMIFNHCGFEHPWVADMPTNDWFNLHEWLKKSKGTSDARGTNFQQTSYKLAPVLDPYASQIDKKETVQGW
ncbi:MAG: cyclomaltodextrinase N-terminal domain-containing protein, partial [Muribaculaceae bacterium]|nr:cyclomaltodextrinase N-terminal domain-containing protein [Muribaculaceae bacterium]